MVLVDGAEQGVTPVLLELEAKNTHRIQLNLAKYESYSSEINLPIGKNTEVSQELRGLPGSISVATMPLGANVTLDGVDLEWKETPCVFENVNSGVHKLDVFQLAKDNKYYAGATYTVNVGPAENVVVNKQLTRDEIILNILDALPGSNLYIDGNSVQDPKVFSDGISMLAGLYEVLLKGPEGQEWSAVASVVTGSCNLNPRGMQYLLPQKTIAIDGKLDDWTSIGPVLFASNNLDPLPKNTGTKISKGYLCRDEKNLYWRMDLADGKPDTKLWNQVHELSLSTGSNAISLSVRNIWGKLVAFIGTNQKAPDEGFYAGSYSLTPSGLEMSFPISSFKKYLKSDFGIVSMRTYVNHGADLMASWQTQDETTSQHIRLAF
jgi:hypothetical protein